MTFASCFRLRGRDKHNGLVAGIFSGRYDLPCDARAFSSTSFET